MNHIKLFVLCAVSLIASPLGASQPKESGFLKKTGRVLFYAAEVGASWHLFTLFHHRRPQSLWPWEMMGKILGDPKNAGSEVLASIMLLRHGLRGLNQELHLTDQFKK